MLQLPPVGCNPTFFFLTLDQLYLPPLLWDFYSLRSSETGLGSQFQNTTEGCFTCLQQKVWVVQKQLSHFRYILSFWRQMLKSILKNQLIVYQQMRLFGSNTFILPTLAQSWLTCWDSLVSSATSLLYAFSMCTIFNMRLFVCCSPQSLKLASLYQPLWRCGPPCRWRCLTRTTRLFLR